VTTVHLTARSIAGELLMLNLDEAALSHHLILNSEDELELVKGILSRFPEVLLLKLLHQYPPLLTVLIHL
jgi:hypothetical protein